MQGLSRNDLLNFWEAITTRLRGVGEVVPRLMMRVIMGWEFWEAGTAKLHGENWFGAIHDSFPFPFNVIPADLSWSIATWFEIIGAIMLWLGLGTRFFAFSLLFLTFVATAAVHWPDSYSMWSDLLKGYAVSDNGHGNYKLPLLFVVMLVPLVFNGAGKFSLDHLLAHWFKLDANPKPIADTHAWALGLAILGLPFLMLLPVIGFALLAISIVLLLFAKFARA